MKLTKQQRRVRIKNRGRKHVLGTGDRPRLSVFRSNREIYAQIIDDSTGKTLCSAASLKNKDAAKGNKTDQAKVIGALIADAAKAKGITTVRFDRNGFLYHGRVKVLAEAVREAGIKF